MARRLAVALVAAAAVAAAVPAAHAGRPGVWTRLSDPPTGASIDWPALARTPDGVLHVAWKRVTPADRTLDDLMHTAIRPGGATIGSQPIVAGWSILGRAALVADPSVGLRALLGGQATTVTGSPNQALSTATSADGGATWTLSPTDVAGGAVLGNEGPTAALVDPVGAVFTVFGSVRVQRGIVAPADSTTIPRFQTACCGGYGNLAATAAGQLWVAWHAVETPTERGIYYQAADPASGAPIGTRTLVPPRYAGDQPPRQPVALAALRGASSDVLIATASRDGVVYTHVLGRTGRTPHTSNGGNSKLWLAADAEGRMWVAWRTRAGSLLARRSNVGATDWGADVPVALPAGARTVHALVADAQTGVLDVVAQLDVRQGAGDPDSGTGAWHTQVRPGLSLRVVDASVRLGELAAFYVRDAGDAVAGARVRVGTRTAVTNASGLATLRIGAAAVPGRRAVRATKAGYTAATDRLTILRR